MNDSTPATPAPAVPARRSDTTRRAILEAARERFAADGYERATIRAIAQQAKIDPSMVMRYYGNKEGLFAAAVAIDLKLPDPSSLPRDEAGRALVTHFLHQWEENEVLTALLRVGVTNDSRRRTHARHLQRPAPPAGPAGMPRPRTGTRARRPGVLTTARPRPDPLRPALPPAVHLHPEEITAWLAPTVQHYLTAPHPGV